MDFGRSEGGALAEKSTDWTPELLDDPFLETYHLEPSTSANKGGF
jgi:hypothetical protein